MLKTTANELLLSILGTSEVLAIFHALGAQANTTRLIGGCIRDALINAPICDLDFATSHPPDVVMKLLDKANIKHIPTGIKHGTISAILNGGIFQITTLRIDLNCNGRHAQVAYSTDWQRDAQRRDFTINALSVDLSGKIYDYFTGITDLAMRKVKFIGTASARILEDHLRILRYFRFCAQLNQNSFDQEAIEAINQHASCVRKISHERLTQEFFKLLQQKNPVPALKAMQKCGIILELFAELPLNYNALENMINLDQSLPANPLRRFAALLSTTENLVQVNQRFKLSNKHRNYLEKMLLSKSPLTIIKTKENLLHLGRELTLDWAIIYASMHDLSKDALDIFLNVINSWNIPTFPLTAADLISLNLTGKALGQLLKKAKAYWQEHDYQPTKEELLSYILK